MQMKIAIPSKADSVDNHFGHCEYYTIYTISESNEIVTVETLESPQGCGCKSDIAAILAKQGVKIMLAGNMGNGAVNKIQSEGIKTIRGCSGNISTVINAYLQGELSDSGESCSQHGGEEHECSH
jgi:predicted Fe-Mo cluster-binding NifX family protein